MFLHFWLCQEHLCCSPTSMCAKAVFDRQTAIRRETHHEMSQWRDVICTTSSVAEYLHALIRFWFDTIQLLPAPTTTIRLKDRSLCFCFLLSIWIGLDRRRPEFVHQNRPSMNGGGYTTLHEALFPSMNSVTRFPTSWNQFVWRPHLRPSASIQVQRVTSHKWTSRRSLKADCRRFNIHNSQLPRDFVNAAARISILS
jgi:hypothetical protein